MHGDWLVAIATIAAAILGIVGGLFLSKYQGERRRVRFTTNTPEDLSAALRVHNGFAIKYGDLTVQELNHASVFVRNTGNASIENFDFSLTLPGPHLLAIAQATSTNDKLWKSITIHYPDMFSKGDQQFQVSVPFFDPGEGFRISTFSNGAPTLCEVSCRVKGVIVHIVTQDTLDTRVRRQATYASLLGAALAISLAFLSFILSYAKLNDAAEITKRLQLDQFKELQKKTTPSPQ